jgi:hypothetical protein
MKEDKNNDQIFRNKLKNYSVDPPEHIWTGIQDQLMKSKRSRRIIYLRWISAAAAVLLAFLGGWYFNQNSETAETLTLEKSTVQPIDENIPGIENIEPSANIEELVASAVESEQLKTETKIIKLKAASVKSDEFLITATESSSEESINLKEIEGRKPAFPINRYKENELHRIKPEYALLDGLSDADREILANNANSNNAIKNNDPKWRLGMMVSPGYSSQVTNHSDVYASNMTYSASNGNTNVTGGISVQVKTSRRLSFESGIYYDQNGQNSENSLQMFAMFDRNEDMYSNAKNDYFSNSVEVKDGSMIMNSNAGVIALDGLPNGAEISTGMESLVTGAPNTLVTSGDLSQVFDFIQIPFYLRYKVVDSRFDVEMIGGINAGMLVGNNAYINNEYGAQNIGKTKDISPLNISGTLGVGLNYKLSDHFSVGAEPRFNYFLSSINKNSDVSYKPYRIGFYTGIYYEF